MGMRLWADITLAMVLLLQIMCLYPVRGGTPPYHVTDDDNLVNSISHNISEVSCTAGGNLTYYDIWDDLLNIRQEYRLNMSLAGGLKAFIEQNPELHGLTLDLLVSTENISKALECCRHPTSTLNITYDYGCPRDSMVCIFDTRLDWRQNVIGLHRPAGCCPIESPIGCFSKHPGNGLRGCCPSGQSCCFGYTPGAGPQRWLGCADDSLQCCDDKICPPHHVCCRNPGQARNVCCPRYGSSCYDNDYKAHIRANGSFEGDDSSPLVHLSQHFNRTFGVHGCLPTPGGENGPVKYAYHIANAEKLLNFNDYECGVEANNRSSNLLRVYLATAPTDSELHFDVEGTPIYNMFPEVFDDKTNPRYASALEDLDIDPELAKYSIPHGDLEFIECGKHLCYGSTHYCVSRYKNHTHKFNPQFVNISRIEEAHAELEFLAAVNISDDVYPPEPLDFVLLDKLNVTCAPYNETYFQGFVDAGVYDNKYLWYNVYGEPVPQICIIYDVEYIITSHEVGCCPLFSKPCGPYGYSFNLPIAAELPKFYSIYDPIIGCALEGETCCAMESICPAGYKCCTNRFTTDGIHPPTLRYIETVILNSTATEEEIADAELSLLRTGVLAPFLNDPSLAFGANITDHPFFLSSIDAFPHCCPVHTFCCQSEIINREVRDRTGRQFYYYCAIDPFCKFHAFFSSRSHIREFVMEHGVPGTDLQTESMDLDYNSDGIYNSLDILDTYAEKKSSTGNNGAFVPYNILNEPSSASDGFTVKSECYTSSHGITIMSCGVLSGTPAPPADGESSGVNPPGPETPETILLATVSASFLEAYPIPEKPDPDIVVFDILGIEVVVNVSSIHSILSPLGHWFLRYRDPTEQLLIEAYYEETFPNFPPPD